MGFFRQTAVSSNVMNISVKKSKKIPIDQMSDLPKTIYKYRIWTDEYHREILSDQIVFMAPPNSFEDPIDCKLQKRWDLLTDKEIYNRYLKESKENNKEFNRAQHREFARDWFKKSPMRIPDYISQKQKEHYEIFNAHFGVLSLTANSKNHEMWNHYSDNCKGFCVGFNTKRMFKHLGGGGPVIYYKELPIIHPDDDFDTEHFKQVFSKEEKWSFEEEYRTHYFYEKPASKDERKIVLPTECFSELIFGANMDSKNKQEIINVCLNKDIKVNFFNSSSSNNKIIIEKYTAPNKS